MVALDSFIITDASIDDENPIGRASAVEFRKEKESREDEEEKSNHRCA
jgi:hypothetical protein